MHQPVDWNAPSYEALVRRHAWRIPDRLNIAALAVDRHADGSGRPGLYYRDQDGGAGVFSFDQLKEWSDRLASGLASLGIAGGDRVAVFLPQRLETALAHLASAKAGAISVPLSPLFRENALEYRLKASGARVLVTDDEHYPFIAPLRSTLTDLRYVISCDQTTRGTEGFWRLVGDSPTGMSPADTSAGDPVMLIYTSGTAGPPKGALHAHRFLPGRLTGFELIHRFTRERFQGRPFWTSADWAWVGGLVDSVFTPWVLGCPVLAYRRRSFVPDDIFALIDETHARSLFLTPTALNMLRHVTGPRERYRLDVFSVHSAGEPLAGETCEWASQTFGSIYELYGMTEVGAIVGNSPFFPVRPGSMGKPYPGHDVALLDHDGLPVPDGETGEVAVHRDDPGMFIGYWNDPEGTAARFRDDYFLTGDLARRDVDGYFWYQGRADDMIKTSGYRVGPTEIEDALEKHPAVARAAVVAHPDPERGSIVKAFVVTRHGYEASEELADSIKLHVRQHLAAYEYPRQIVFARELPMTVTGKIRRAELRSPDADERFGIRRP